MSSHCAQRAERHPSVRSQQKLALCRAILTGIIAISLTFSVIGCSSHRERSGIWLIETTIGSVWLTVNDEGKLITKIECKPMVGDAKGAFGSFGALLKTGDFKGWTIDKAGHFAIPYSPFVIDLFNSKVNTMGSMSGTFEKGDKTAYGTLLLKNDKEYTSTWTTKNRTPKAAP